jgi:diketogulonate reductase-like aldo/keto reductase
MNTSVSLNDGRSMPLLGLGVMQTPDAATPAAIATATGLGYRLVDTAPIYGNEPGVSRGVRECGVPRTELFNYYEAVESAAGLQ